MSHILSDKTTKIGIPHDSKDITPTEKLRYDACVTLEGLEDFKPKGKVGVQTLQGGKYAVITHHGDIGKNRINVQHFVFGVVTAKSL